MSGICGVLRFDYKEVTEKTVHCMLASMNTRGNDAVGLWIDKSVGFGQKILKTTTESFHKNQPLISSCGNLTLTADARVDNRFELCRELSVKTDSIDGITDSELILLAYEKWGEDCTKHLYGDFAFAIWDKHTQKLFCARDHIGIKPFYYYFCANFLIFASEISSLFSHELVPRQINSEAIECSLLFDAIPYTQTYFSDIFCLQGSTYAVFTQKGEKYIKKYWSPTDKQYIRDISFEEAAQELKSLLFKATKDRLRSSYPISFELSGGLDSSSVVSLAHQISNNLPLHLYSLRFGELPCDEGLYINAICERVGNKTNEVRVDQLEYTDELSLTNYYKQFPDWPMDLFFIPHLLLKNMAAKDRCRVMLTGQGGDEVLQGSRYMLADMLRKRMWKKLAYEIMHSRYKKDDMLYFLLRPLVPKKIRKIRRFMLSQTNKQERLFYESYLKKVVFNDDFELRSSYHTARMIFGPEHALWTNMNSYNFYGDKNIEVRHPLFDVRLIEFRLTTPPEYFYSKSTFKRLFRHAMKGILPETVRKRKDKANFDAIVKAQLKSEIDKDPSLEKLENLQIKKCIKKEIWNLLPKFHAKRSFRESDLFLQWKIINLELWYRQNFCYNTEM